MLDAGRNTLKKEDMVQYVTINCIELGKPYLSKKMIGMVTVPGKRNVYMPFSFNLSLLKSFP